MRNFFNKKTKKHLKKRIIAFFLKNGADLKATNNKGIPIAISELERLYFGDLVKVGYGGNNQNNENLNAIFDRIYRAASGKFIQIN